MDTDILNLPGLKSLQVTENEYGDYRIMAEAIASPSFLCPVCGSPIIGFGKREQLFMDLPTHGKRTGIVVIRKRYRCSHKSCLKTFFEPLAGMDEKRAATKRLIEYIEKQSLKRTFASISDDIGLDEKTIRNIFRDYVNRLEKEVRFETPKLLGIDEIHIIRPRCVICNVQDRTIIDLLPNRNKDTVIRYLYQLPGREIIRYVCMDMWAPYREAVAAILPQAIIVVDKFHIQRMANQALDTVRKGVREKLTPRERRTLMHDRFILLKRYRDLDAHELLVLESWLKNFEDLGVAYQLKEQFFDIWESKSRREALERYQLWKSRIPVQIEAAFRPITTAVSNWDQEIFAYFDHPVTNAYTEALNSLIRVMNRLGRGYSFAAIRAKILFTEGLAKQKTPVYRKMYQTGDLPGNTMVVREGDSCQENNCGIDIRALIDKIEDGDF